MSEQENPGVAWRESYAALEQGLERLVGEAKATAAFVIRGDGQLVTWAGGALDPSSLGALAAGSMATSGALLASVEDRGIPCVFLDGDAQSFFLQAIDRGTFLVVQFDRRGSLGLVRLRARRLAEEARPWVAGLGRGQEPVFDGLEETDLDLLFESN